MDFSPKKELIRFLEEDIGKGDITSNILPKKKISAKIISRESGIVAGVKYAKDLFSLKKCSCKILKKDGAKIKPNQIILTIRGDAASVLECERTALNLLSRMSGIATKTNKLVCTIKKVNKNVDLFATRKTAPGLRFFDKEAVRIGGGQKHRMTLHDSIMIKDNHIAVGGFMPKLIFHASKQKKIIEVEVESSEDAVIAAAAGAKIIMLDNFVPKKIKQTIVLLKKANLRNKIKIEASGGITEKNIEDFARTGVDMISVGEITHSVNGIDFSLEVE